MSVQVRGKLPGSWVNRTFTEVKGRSDYPCSVCEKIIPKGVKHYRYATFTSQGTARVHIECIQIGV